MKIAFDGRALGKPPHSARRVLVLWIDAARRMGWQVDLWTCGPLPSEFSRYDELVVPMSAASKAPGASACWIPELDSVSGGTPAVVALHDVNPLLPDGRPFVYRLLRALRFRFRVSAIAGRAWRVVTDSEHAKAQICGMFPRLAGKLRVVPLYVDRSVSKSNGAGQERLLKSAGIGRGFVLFVGGLRRHKNWDGLVRAYARLPDEIRGRHPLVLAGPATREFGNARALAASCGVGANVHVLGAVDEATLRALYGAAALFVFPSVLEGFGLPPLEAMACGVPVAASNRSSIPEVLGDAALYFDPMNAGEMADAMRRMLTDDVFRREFADRGIRRASEYSAKRTGHAMEVVMKERG